MKLPAPSTSVPVSMKPYALCSSHSIRLPLLSFGCLRKVPSSWHRTVAPAPILPRNIGGVPSALASPWVLLASASAPCTDPLPSAPAPTPKFCLGRPRSGLCFGSVLASATASELHISPTLRRVWWRLGGELPSLLLCHSHFGFYLGSLKIHVGLGLGLFPGSSPRRPPSALGFGLHPLESASAFPRRPRPRPFRRSASPRPRIDLHGSRSGSERPSTTDSASDGLFPGSAPRWPPSALGFGLHPLESASAFPRRPRPPATHVSFGVCLFLLASAFICIGLQPLRPPLFPRPPYLGLRVGPPTP